MKKEIETSRLTRKVLAVLFTVCMIFGFAWLANNADVASASNALLATAQAADADWTYTANEADATATITGYVGTSTELNIPEKIANLTVVAIGNEAFIGNKDITKLTIPDTVTTMGVGAFKDCTNLTEVSIGSGLTNWSTKKDIYGHGYSIAANAAFQGCTSLSTVTMKEGAANVGPYAFYNCTQLETVNVPKGILYRSAFDGCIYLKNVTLGDITELYEYAFKNCDALQTIILPETLTSIGQEAFISCTSLRAITIPDAVTTIGLGAFKGCTVLETVVIGSGVTTWITKSDTYSHGYSVQTNAAFEGCILLKNLTVKSGVTSIGPHAFYGCMLLSGVELPESVTSIGQHAFYNCSKLTKAAIPNGTIGANAFENCVMLDDLTLGQGVTSIGAYAFKGCSSLRLITLPDGLKTIDNEAFINCTALLTITIPDLVETIGVGAFKDCTSLRTAVIGAGVKTWKTKTDTYSHGYSVATNSAFEGCTLLEAVTFKEGVANIGHFAFYNCTKLKAVDLPKSVTTVNHYAFANCMKIKTAAIAKGTIQTGAFENCEILETVTLGAVTGIGAKAFKNCPALTSVGFPEGLTQIDNEAFYGDKAITVVSIPDTVATIGYGAFKDCTALTQVAIGAGVTTWKTTTDIYNHGYSTTANSAFENCTALKTLTVKSGTTAIGHYAFFNCTRLEEVILPNTVYNVYNYAFHGCTGLKKLSVNNGSIGQNAFENCTALTDISLVDVNTIGNYAFKNCTLLKNFTLPHGLTLIGNEAFSACNSLTKAVIPNTVKTIGFGAFIKCSGLKSLIVGSGITTWTTKSNYGHGYSTNVNSAFENCTALETVVFADGANCVGKYAFYGCTALKSVCFPESTKTFENNIFDNCLDVVLCVPNEDSYAYTYAVNNNLQWKLHEGLSVIELKVEEMPAKTVYQIGEALNPTGLRLSVMYDDISMEVIDSGYEITGFTSGIPGQKYVTVLYKNAYTQFEVSVEDEARQQYTLTFNPNGGTVAKESVVAEVDTPVVLPMATKTITLKFDANGGSGAPDDETVEFDCLGWAKTADAETVEYKCNEIITVTANESFYAIWEKAATAVVNGNAPTKEGYIFKGWFTAPVDGTQVGVTFEMSENTTLYAQWESNGEQSQSIELIAQTAQAKFINETALGVSADMKPDELLKLLTPGVVLSDENGQPVEKLKTGLTLTLTNGDEVIDTKTVIVKGDVDCDGDVTAADARLALRASVGLESLNENPRLAAKVDKTSTAIGASDARLILRSSVNLESKESLV